MSLSRRSFLLTTGAAFATPLDALRARLEAGAAAPTELGYGPLRPVADATTGMPLLELPKGFRYMTFGWTGDAMDDGRRIPPQHDGMAAFAGENGRVVLVRNHEIGSGVAFEAPTYDSKAGGGTTTTVFDPATEKIVSTQGSRRVADGQRPPPAALLGRGQVAQVGPVTLAGVDHEQAGLPGGRQQALERRHDAGQLADVVAQHRPEAPRLQEIALHVDDEQRRLSRNEFEGVRLGIDV